MDTPLSRRDFLTRATAVGASVVLLPTLASLGQSSGTDAAGEFACGIVFDDTPGKGARTADSKGLAGVLVSNGRDVVHTDTDGAYQIPVRDGDVLFVIKPAHWMTSLSAYNLPKFYYFHRPTGSPPWKPVNVPDVDKLNPTYFYPGSQPTGPLPASIDFPLQRRPEPDEFKVLVFGDTQVTHDHQMEYMARDTLAELVGAPGVAFAISLGDLVNVGQLHMFEPLNQMQAKLGFPLYAIPGNHDQNLVTPDDELAVETYRSVYGPPMYAFDYGPVSFLMLDNIRRRPFTKLESANVEPGKGVPLGDDYTCGLRDDQWLFVENYLKTVPLDRQLVLCMHCPPTQACDPENRFHRRLFSLLSGRPYTLSMSGHTHVQDHTFHGPEDGFSGPGQHHHFNSICVRGDGYRGIFDELRLPCCLAVDGTPNGYSFIHFNRIGYTIEYKPSRSPDRYQMNIFVSSIIKRDKLDRELVRANIFAGSPRSSVRMRVNNLPWQSMNLTLQKDPAMSWMLETQNKPQSWLGSKYNRDDIPDSTHIWQAALPINLADGTHALLIETTDMFGNTHRGTSLFRVTSS